MSLRLRKAWYVTFELPRSKQRIAARRASRFSRTFLMEEEAKAFARDRCNEGLIVSAGTLNPYLPRQIIPSAAIHEWIGDVSKHADCESQRGLPTPSPSSNLPKAAGRIVKKS